LRAFGFAFRSTFLVASSVEVTAASQDPLSLCRRFGRGDFMSLVEMGEENAPRQAIFNRGILLTGRGLGIRLSRIAQMGLNRSLVR
jgi:hypothetical protein